MTERVTETITKEVTEMELAKILAEELGSRYTVRDTEAGVRILDTKKGNSTDWLSQTVAYVSHERRPDRKRFVDLDESFQEHAISVLRRKGIRLEHRGRNTFFQNLVSYDGLDFPELTPIGQNNDLVFYEKNGVKCKGSSMFPNNIYFYFEKEQVARLVFNPDEKVVLDVQQNPDESRELLEVAVAISKDLPFRDHLERRFDIDESNEKTQKHLKVYQSEISRIERLLGEYDSKLKLPDWETTNPSAYNSSNFRFIVHTLVNDEGPKKALRGMIDAQSNASGIGTTGDSNVDPIKEPQKFVGRKYISCSVLDECHYGTWDNTGFVLKVPRKNILQADSQDMGTIPSDAMGYGSENLPSAQKILRGTSFNSYNEVLIHGTNPSTKEQIRIEAGLVVRNPITQKPLDSEMTYKVEDFCRRNHLPVIYINKPLGG